MTGLFSRLLKIVLRIVVYLLVLLIIALLAVFILRVPMAEFALRRFAGIDVSIGRIDLDFKEKNVIVSKIYAPEKLMVGELAVDFKNNFWSVPDKVEITGGNAQMEIDKEGNITVLIPIPLQGGDFSSIKIPIRKFSLNDFDIAVLWAGRPNKPVVLKIKQADITTPEDSPHFINFDVELSLATATASNAGKGYAAGFIDFSKKDMKGKVALEHLPVDVVADYMPNVPIKAGRLDIFSDLEAQNDDLLVKTKFVFYLPQTGKGGAAGDLGNLLSSILLSAQSQDGQPVLGFDFNIRTKLSNPKFDPAKSFNFSALLNGIGDMKKLTETPKKDITDASAGIPPSNGSVKDVKESLKETAKEIKQQVQEIFQ